MNENSQKIWSICEYKLFFDLNSKFPNIFILNQQFYKINENLKKKWQISKISAINSNFLNIFIKIAITSDPLLKLIYYFSYTSSSLLIEINAVTFVEREIFFFFHARKNRFVDNTLILLIINEEALLYQKRFAKTSRVCDIKKYRRH